jgi:hypothetical protein
MRINGLKKTQALIAREQLILLCSTVIAAQREHEVMDEPIGNLPFPGNFSRG